MAGTNSTNLVVPIQNLEFTDYILDISVIDPLKQKLSGINWNEIEITKIGTDTTDSVKIKNLKSYIKIVEYFLSNYETISVEDRNLLSPLILNPDNTPFFNYSKSYKTDIQYIVAICYFKLLLLQLNIDILDTYVCNDEIDRQKKSLFDTMKEELEGIITDTDFFNQLLNHSQDGKIYIKTIYELYLIENNKEIEFLVYFIQNLKQDHQFKNIIEELTQFNASRKPQINASSNTTVATKSNTTVVTTPANNPVVAVPSNTNVVAVPSNTNVVAVPSNTNVVAAPSNTTVAADPKTVVTQKPSTKVISLYGRNGTLGIDRPTLRKAYEDLKRNFENQKSNYERKIKSERNVQSRESMRRNIAIKLESYLEKIKQIKKNMGNKEVPYYHNHNPENSRNISDPTNIPNSLDQLEENIQDFQREKSLISLSDQYENLKSLFEEKSQLYKSSLVVDVLTGHANPNFINSKKRALKKLNTIINRINELKEKIEKLKNNNNTKSSLTNKINTLKQQVVELIYEITTAEEHNNEPPMINKSKEGTYIEVTPNLKKDTYIDVLPNIGRNGILGPNKPILVNEYTILNEQFERLKSNYNDRIQHKKTRDKAQFNQETNNKLDGYLGQIKKIMENIKQNPDHYTNHSQKTQSRIIEDVNKLKEKIISFKQNTLKLPESTTTLEVTGGFKKTRKLSLNRKLKSKHKITKSIKHKINKTIKHKMNKTKKKH